MKKYILLILSITICTKLIAHEEQRSLSFLDGNPIWVFKSEHLSKADSSECWIDTGSRLFYYYFMGGEKKILNNSYTIMGQVMMKDGKVQATNWLPVREEGGVVYALMDHLPGVIDGTYNVGSGSFDDLPYTRCGKECVLYDFNLQLGEHLPILGNYYVTSLDTCQLLDGTDCKVMVISDLIKLYDGIGYISPRSGILMDPWYNNDIVLTSNDEIYSRCLNAYYRDGKMLYKAPEPHDGLCLNDTCWDFNAAYSYASSYKDDSDMEEVMAFIYTSPIPDDNYFNLGA
ncbi:MAG: hypothetical protein HUJ56_02800, partial [Erysipelotrichaceae bacterium]|nr:hypothetical protein [Erysipelotrichaceae bacterium]